MERGSARVVNSTSAPSSTANGLMKLLLFVLLILQADSRLGERGCVLV
jgi:hypothetical protein